MSKRRDVLFFLGVLVFLTGHIFALAASKLPQREGPRPKSTQGIPHQQIGDKVNPKIHSELIRRTFKISGIEKKASFTPYAEAKALWLSEKIKAKHPESFLSGREFAHFHPDGTMHVQLSEDRAKQAVQSGWATHHPFAKRQKGWAGLILVYAPQNDQEMEVVFQLIVDSINYMTGRSLKAADLKK